MDRENKTKIGRESRVSKKKHLREMEWESKGESKVRKSREKINWERRENKKWESWWEGGEWK